MITKEFVIKRLKLLSENKGVQTLSYDEAKVLIAEIERLNNIINEFERWLEEMKKYYGVGYYDTSINKLQELKGSNNNE